jgi:putative ABC transport system substrate-binding protein
MRQQARGNSKKVQVCGFALCSMLLALSFSADAQQSAKVPRIGFLASGGPESPNIMAFRRGLHDLGYVEGKNVLVEYRHLEAKVDRVPRFVAELVQLKVDVLIITNTPAIRVAKQATSTIPIVMVSTVDPVATGLVDSLARPGGNVTGLTRLTRELSGKRLELLREIVPRISRVGILWSNSE